MTLDLVKEVLTIAEVAERCGVATSALRFYQQRGLIRAERTSAGHRRHPRAVIRRIAFIVFAQRVGLTLDEIGVARAYTPRLVEFSNAAIRFVGQMTVEANRTALQV